MPNFAFILRSAFFHGGSFVCFETKKLALSVLGTLEINWMVFLSVQSILAFGFFSLFLKFSDFIFRSVSGWRELEQFCLLERVLSFVLGSPK